MQQTSRSDDNAAETIARFHAYARLISVDPERNRFRYYSLTWQPGLWGGGALVRCWGRIGMKGRSQETPYRDRSSAQGDVDQLVKRRLRHGYQVVDSR
jgi:predicted DNA-binding WGR domain protein